MGLTDEQMNSLNKAGEELEKVREEYDCKPNEVKVDDIFSDDNWKLARITYSAAGARFTMGHFAAVNEKDGTFYNHKLFAGRITGVIGETHIEYEIVTQESYLSFIQNGGDIVFAQYDYHDA